MTRDLWDDEATSFDDEPDHGLADANTRAAWRDLLMGVLPPAPARVADLGCGTGTLTHLLSEVGYLVDGLDFSPGMLQQARRKVPDATFVLGEAADPDLASASYDAVLSRHVLWALPEPERVLARWVDLLKPGGVVVLVEGSWATGAGLTATEAERIVRHSRSEVTVQHLTGAVYWGKEIRDERYLLTSQR